MQEMSNIEEEGAVRETTDEKKIIKLDDLEKLAGEKEYLEKKKIIVVVEFLKNNINNIIKNNAIQLKNKGHVIL